METSAGLAHAPFLAQVSAKACKCNGPVFEVGRARTAERAVERIVGYWNVYIGFYGNQLVWMMFDVVDIRDGRVVWRNGRYTNTKESSSGHIA